ncbi:hypothetical protein ATO12_05090 [Aquimarina atlantica]|uniref:Secretion system C-terminal sorting domain-containing protein n=1 Tax=Aquimarina atlantica TaxID=1317122 RepID=A0A023BPK6_9FLAO|nr:T9SS type A sorting domain-containing protein [Aquimarina atlantica]EZH71992.1 hypothetical protein ATO12_05090 [Aquimarina atlantica]
MKTEKLIALFLLFINITILFSQEVDTTLVRLKSALNTSIEDTTKIKAMLKLGEYQLNRDFSSAEGYFDQGLTLLENKTEDHYQKFRTALYVQLGVVHRRKAEYPKAIEYYVEALKYYEKNNNVSKIADVYHTESLTGTTNIITQAATAKVNVEINTGTTPYTAKINNEIVGEYTAKNFTVEVQHGDELEISSNADCQGKLATKVSLFDQVSIAPNPTNGDVTLTLPDTQLQTINVSIYNALGVWVSSGEYIITSGQVIVPMKQLPQGIYFVSIDRGATFKIVKQ